MATANFYLKEPDSKGKTPIRFYFRFSENKQKRKVLFSTKESVHPKDWDEKNQKVRRTVSDFYGLNKFI